MGGKAPNHLKTDLFVSGKIEHVREAAPSCCDSAAAVPYLIVCIYKAHTQTSEVNILQASEGPAGTRHG